MSPAIAPTIQHSNAAYEPRFADLFTPGFSFPGDAQGRVGIDSLGHVARTNYLYARTVIGREFRTP